MVQSFQEPNTLTTQLHTSNTVLLIATAIMERAAVSSIVSKQWVLLENQNQSKERTSEIWFLETESAAQNF